MEFEGGKIIPDNSHGTFPVGVFSTRGGLFFPWGVIFNTENFNKDPNSSSTVHGKSMKEKPLGVPDWGIPGLDERWLQWKQSRANKNDVKFRTLLFGMNQPLEISLHPFLAVSSGITSPCFPGKFWDLEYYLFRLFLKLTLRLRGHKEGIRTSHNNFFYSCCDLSAVSYHPLLSSLNFPAAGKLFVACDRCRTFCGFSPGLFGGLRWQKTGLRGPQGLLLFLCSQFDFCPGHPKGRICSFSIFGIEVYLQLLWNLESVQSVLADAFWGLWTPASHEGRKKSRGFLRSKAKGFSDYLKSSPT